MLLVSTNVLIPVFNINIKNRDETFPPPPSLVTKIGISVTTMANTRWKTSPDGLDQQGSSFQ